MVSTTLFFLAALCGLQSVAGSKGAQVDGSAWDSDLEDCPECDAADTWSVLQGFPDTEEVDEAEPLPRATETRLLDNGVVRDSYGEGAEVIITFGGFSSTKLCTSYERKAPINGDKSCPLKQDWYLMWSAGPPKDVVSRLTCWIDDMVSYQKGSTYSNAPGTTTVMGACPAKGSAPNPKYENGAYDWRYGGIRPQDNANMALYPQIAEYITESVNKTGKKVVVRGCSGGTINGYAFIMSQPLAWRQKHIMAFVAVAPVFGGTISSIQTIVAGHQVGAGDAGRCLGRLVSARLPSVFWMWPHPGTGEGEWNKTEVLIQTPTKNYTAYDFAEMLKDMGMSDSELIYAVEKADYLGKFEPPMIDTYVFYGYGIATEAGYIIGHNFSAAADGQAACPPVTGNKVLSRKWDDGDKTAPLRSTAKASVWAKAHGAAGHVLRNHGYQGQAHACDCRTAQCKTDYACVMNKLAGLEHVGC